MFNHRFDQNANNTVAMHWFLLSFSGGAINAGGFLATGRFVSHVTGFATLFGVDITNHQIQAAFGILSVPLFFLLGAFLAGLLIDKPIYQGRQPHFDWVMGLSAFCLFFASAGGEILQLGTFGYALGLKENYVLLGLLCLASGLQNAAITSSSGRSVRTTHLTGLTTDLGLGLARIFAFDAKEPRLRAELRANYLRIGSIIAFIIGSAIGAWIFLKLGYRGFILPGLISVYASWHGKKAKITPHLLPTP
ncbi:MAG: YoaK family protein [Bacteriovoracia bacterium]